ncbi:MAG: biotin/lipoyl-containing protein [Thermoprotei archaeon]
MAKIYRVYSDTGDLYTLAVETQGNKYVIKTEQNTFEVEFRGQGTKEWESIIVVNGNPRRVEVDRGYLIIDGSEVFRIDRISEEAPKEGATLEEMLKGKEGEVLSPLQGRVVQIRVKEGDAVNKGQPLLSIEAMKSETVISAPKAGVVKKINVKVGQGVRKGDVLLIIE